MDIVNLAGNENDSTNDLALAFVGKPMELEAAAS